MSSSETYPPLAPPPSSLPVKPPDPTPDIHDTDIAETSSPPLRTRLVQIWQPKGQLDLLDLGAGCFLARLSQSDDIERVIKRGPWMVQGHYLIVRQWFPKFRPELDVIERTLAWVRLPGLPLMYYYDDFLETVARGVGCLIRVDSNTSTTSRALYARMCMEIDLTLPLIPDVTIHSEHFKVHYEGLHIICMSCGTYGHNASACTSPLKCSTPISIIDPVSGAAVSDQMEQDVHDVPVAPTRALQDFGEWMVVGRPVRRPPRDWNPIEQKNGPGGKMVNRFAALSEDMSSVEPVSSLPRVPMVNDMMRVVPPRLKRGRSDLSTSTCLVFSTGPADKPISGPSSSVKTSGPPKKDKLPRAPSVIPLGLVTVSPSPSLAAQEPSLPLIAAPVPLQVPPTSLLSLPSAPFIPNPLSV
ncbi:hypothetical protein Tsubulata_012614 [Turnera subulata]|uniref:DUF4283 domain-containing protein n=1 Tax=Turnera subulata TaxID=218843 RepID=A0A9Q0FPB2_9ROSI|nr:hypothetical protein Tsubulata_012614 [Turnera subulata]